MVLVKGSPAWQPTPVFLPGAWGQAVSVRGTLRRWPVFGGWVLALDIWGWIRGFAGLPFTNTMPHSCSAAQLRAWTRGLPDPGIEPVSPASQADSLPSEPPGKLPRLLQMGLPHGLGLLAGRGPSEAARDPPASGHLPQEHHVASVSAADTRE